MTITIVAPACAYSGFGRSAIELFSRFSERGHICKFMPATVEEMLDGKRIDFPQVIKDAFVTKVEGLELVHAPLLWDHIPQTSTAAIFTMYESTRIPKRHVDVLNQYAKVVTPTLWNKDVFLDSGVTRPVYVANLGVDTETFSPRKPTERPLCVFGAAAWLKPSQHRKNFSALMTAWRAAFPGIKDVRLSLKTLPGDSPLCDLRDDRIGVDKSFMQPYQLANWYNSLSAFISTSRCEGWNLMAHEAMACDVPVISHREGAHREILSFEGCFPCWAKMVPHSKADSEFGFDWEIDIDDLVDAMRFVHQDRLEASLRGAVAGQKASEMTWDRTADKIEEVLNA